MNTNTLNGGESPAFHEWQKARAVCVECDRTFETKRRYEATCPKCKAFETLTEAEIDRALAELDSCDAR